MIRLWNDLLQLSSTPRYVTSRRPNINMKKNNYKETIIMIMMMRKKGENDGRAV